MWNLLSFRPYATRQQINFLDARIFGWEHLLPDRQPSHCLRPWVVLNALLFSCSHTLERRSHSQIVTTTTTTTTCMRASSCVESFPCFPRGFQSARWAVESTHLYVGYVFICVWMVVGICILWPFWFKEAYNLWRLKPTGMEHVYALHVARVNRFPILCFP